MEVARMQKKKAEFPRPNKAMEKSVRARIEQSNAGFTRDELRRDTYVPSSHPQKSPRPLEFANRA
jgi:hypothetical protein